MQGLTKLFQFFFYLLPLVLAIVLFWPVYKNIPIENSFWMFGEERPSAKNRLDIKPLKIKLDEEFLGMLVISLPPIRHKICFKNKNKVYLIHSDSDNDLVFQTQDVSDYKELALGKVGAMTMSISYSDAENGRYYREIGQGQCEKFNVKNLQNQRVASSTIEYRHGRIIDELTLLTAAGEEIDLKKIVGQSLIETSASGAYLRANLLYFVVAWLILELLFVKVPVFGPLKKEFSKKCVLALRRKAKRWLGSHYPTPMSLLSKKCVPCEGGVSPLSSEEIEKYLPEVSGWEVLENKKIVRDFTFKNFKEALVFVNKVGDLAEKENHHPDILLHSWNKVRIELWTHAIGGLSENDFILAAKTNTLS